MALYQDPVEPKIFCQQQTDFLYVEYYLRSYFVIDMFCAQLRAIHMFHARLRAPFTSKLC